MSHQGGCHCGAVRYEVSGEPQHSSICHCSDCRKCAGAPFVQWAAYASGDFKVVAGAPRDYNSSGEAHRFFCAACGTGLYYVNEQVLPGLVDIQVSTLDDPETVAPMLHVQAAEKLSWVDKAAGLPAFERYPG
jgi:hypothetical protein